MLQHYLHDNLIEAGCDEAGRGCYAGPVFAAAVILPNNFYHPLLNDSKQVKEADRNTLRNVIEKSAISFAVACIMPDEIDKINILQASFKAMHKAIEQLSIAPEHLLIDGNKFTPHPTIPHTCIVKGDSQFTSIAAASILAKTYRDAYMCDIAKEYPQYAWEQNKGYGTKTHREAIAQYGLTQHHRKSFNILPTQLKLFE